MKMTLKALNETSTNLCSLRNSLQFRSSRHWLLDAIYGRELLKLKLRQLGLDLVVPDWSEPKELEPLLTHAIDVLGIGAWRKPSGLAQRLRYLRTVIWMMLDVREGRQVTCPRGD
jgi:hypothetical protein